MPLDGTVPFVGTLSSPLSRRRNHIGGAPARVCPCPQTARLSPGTSRVAAQGHAHQPQARVPSVEAGRTERACPQAAQAHPGATGSASVHGASPSRSLVKRLHAADIPSLDAGCRRAPRAAASGVCRRTSWRRRPAPHVGGRKRAGHLTGRRLRARAARQAGEKKKQQSRSYRAATIPIASPHGPPHAPSGCLPALRSVHCTAPASSP